jgi:hypothetical protein
MTGASESFVTTISTSTPTPHNTITVESAANSKTTPQYNQNGSATGSSALPKQSYQVPLNDNNHKGTTSTNGVMKSATSTNNAISASAITTTTPSGARSDSPDFGMIDIVDGCIDGGAATSEGERSLGDFSAASHEMASKAFKAMASSNSIGSGSDTSSGGGLLGISKLDPATRQRTSTTDSEAVASTGKGMKHSTSKIFSDREDKMTDLKGRVVHIEVPFGKPIEEVYEGVQTGPVLGSGISGLVRLCVHQKTGVKYAVKCLDLGLIDTEAQLKQLKEEIYIMCQLDHPNIVRLEEVYESHKYVFIDCAVQYVLHLYYNECTNTPSKAAQCLLLQRGCASLFLRH